MIKALIARLKQGHRTTSYPDGPATVPERFVGRPAVDQARCLPAADCEACLGACPTKALERVEGRMVLDLGRCLFCQDCARVCPEGAVDFTTETAMATRSREHLRMEGRGLELARALEGQALRLFGRSLRLRQVSAAGCNGCEVEVNVLGTVVYDLSRFGIGFVASPRHADGLLITGPVSQNMRQALLETWQAVPAPRLVIAVGACAISGGPYVGHPEVCDGAGSLVPIDLYVPGCPPHPYTTLDGLLRLLGRL